MTVRKTLKTTKQKWHAARRAEHELKQRRSHLARLNRRRAAADSPPVMPGSRGGKKKKHRFHPLPAPKDFSLVDNADAVLRYFRDAHELLRNRQRVTFDLANIDRLTPDAIALLVASVQNRRFRCGMNVSGNEPANETAKRMFTESGFYGHVRTDRIVPPDKKNLLLHRVTRNKVENGEAMNAGKSAVSHLFSDGRRIRPLYEILIECMANTNNHADPNRRGFYDWWLFTYNDPVEVRTIFTFLDLGVGIFRTLRVRSWWNDVIRGLGLTRNVDILPRLLSGDMTSRTRKPERGKGIPRINQRAVEGTFSRFTMISEDVYADLIRQEFRTLRVPLHGTLYCFEIRPPVEAA